MFLPDGTICYIGRIDSQIKLRGFRIELGEIDSKILSYPKIKESVTIIHDKTICSYVVPKEDFSVSELKKFLEESLPSFMIPSFIVNLDSLPLNVSGKVDKRALPKPSLDSLDREIVPARNDLDEIIIEKLKEILHLDSVSIKDSFFGIGGDSLSAISLAVHLSSSLETSISVKDIFDNPIIENLSDAISNKHESYKAPVISKAKVADSYPLSCSQKRIYYANAASGKDSLVYNVSGGLLFDSILDFDKVKTALNRLVEIHPSFRTEFKYGSAGELTQSIREVVTLSLDEEHSSLSPQEIINNFPKPFDLSKAPLLRAKLYILGHQKSLLVLDSHHIILDRNFFFYYI